MENSFSKLIDSASSVLVLLPEKPTFDEVAAGLSFYLSLRDQKQTVISCPSPMMVGFNRLIGVDKISSEVGDKNLTIRFAGYDAANIDKVSYDIEQGEFRLTVTPKTGLLAPTDEQVVTNHAGVSADVVILVGGKKGADFPLISSKELTGANFAHIGTRVLDSSSEVMSFARPGSSVSELVAIIIKETGLTLDADSATNLVMGIEEGSSNFTSSEVTPETFETFAHLLRSGGKRQPKIKLSPMDFPPGAVPQRPFFRQPRRTPEPMKPENLPQEVDTRDIEGTKEEEQFINPPDDWLQPKVFKGADVNPDSFSENKG